MKQQTDTSQPYDLQLDHKIKKVLDSPFPLPEQVEQAKKEAFAKINGMAAGEISKETQGTAINRGHGSRPAAKTSRQAQKHSGSRKFQKTFFPGLAVAGAAIFCCIYFTNTDVSAQVPIVSHIFEKLEKNLEFSGEYAGLAEPVGQDAAGLESITANGTTITLSEAYCNGAALYLSLSIHSQDPLPDTFIGQDGKPVVEHRTSVDFDFDEEGEIDWLNGGSWHTDGEMLDEHTYACVIRFDFGQYYAEKGVEIPDSFHTKLSISKIAGTKLEDTRPELPQELQEQYETAMKENGLGLTEEDQRQFTEEQKDTEQRLFNEMRNAYYELYPERLTYPNQYDNWILDGPWHFEFDVTRNNSDVIRKDINDVDENGLGIIAVAKTPMELTVETEENLDYFPVVLDADGNLMDASSSSFNTVSTSGHDTSKVDVYICDYIEYMDELKGYWWSEDYEEKAKVKTFRQLLDERALYHKEILFEEP